MSSRESVKKNHIKKLMVLLIFSITLMNVTSFHMKTQQMPKRVFRNNKMKVFLDVQNKNDSSKGYTLLNKFQRPTDTLFYTQGFKFLNQNTIVESAGLYGHSLIHLLDTQNFNVKKTTNMGTDMFGEGCALFLNSKNEQEAHQLTWQERKIYIYDANTLKLKQTIAMPSQMREGWGLCMGEIQNDNGEQQQRFFATDGSNKVFIIDPENWNVEKELIVYNQGVPVNDLNDLEYINGNLLINVYLTTNIVKVNATNGQLQQTYDFNDFKKEVFNTEIFIQNSFDYSHCLNGIAYNKFTDTGKKWPIVFEVKFD